MSTFKEIVEGVQCHFGDTPRHFTANYRERRAILDTDTLGLGLLSYIAANYFSHIWITTCKFQADISCRVILGTNINPPPKASLPFFFNFCSDISLYLLLLSYLWLIPQLWPTSPATLSCCGSQSRKCKKFVAHHCTMGKLKNLVKSSQLSQIISLSILIQNFQNFAHSSLNSPITQINTNIENKYLKN